MEIDYLDELFDIVCRKFLNAIDNIEYHPVLPDGSPSDIRGKNFIHFSETGYYCVFDHRLTQMEELFIDKLLVTLENMNSTLTHTF